MTFIHLTIPYVVTAASRPRVTRYGTFYAKNYTAFREVIGEWLDKLKPINMEKKHPLEGAIKAKFVFTIPMPKSYNKKKKEKLLGKPMILKGDIDNYCKAIMDLLQGRYFEDDSQIYHVTASKYWGNEGSIEITLENEEEV